MLKSTKTPLKGNFKRPKQMEKDAIFMDQETQY